MMTTSRSGVVKKAALPTSIQAVVIRFIARVSPNARQRMRASTPGLRGGGSDESRPA
jgi:hypothetical protein